MTKKAWALKGYALMILFLGPILVGISFQSVFQKIDIIRRMSIDMEKEAPPEADFTFTSTGECADQAVQFTSTATGDKLSYQWNFGDPNSGNNNASTKADPSHLFVGTPGNGTESFTVTLTVTDEAGLQHSVIKSITRNQIPSLTVGSDKEQNTFDNLQYFIVCENNSSDFTFYNNSTTKSSNVRYEIDWGDGTPKFEGDSWEIFTHSYEMGIYNIKYSITGDNGCVASKTFGVFIGSNPAVGLGNPGNTNICSEASLSFPITSTENNPVGTTYTVTFSDGSEPMVFNHPPPATVEHVFEESSCGEFTPGYPNSFSATITAANPCATSSATVVPIYVTKAPEPEMEVPEEAVCVDTPTLIKNVTLYSNEVSNNGNCSDQGKFTWEITPATGWTLTNGSLGNRPDPNAPNSWSVGSTEIRPTFTEPGTYTITLFSGNRCGIGEIQETICVIPTPVPAFTLDQTEGCGPIQVKTTNETNILGICGPSEFDWSVSYSAGSCGTQAGWEFAAGSDRSSQDPVFNFNNPGEYTIHLEVTANCGTFTSEETINVYAPPTAAILDIADVCGAAIIRPQATVIACGTEEPIYKWTFEDGIPTNSNSLDPGEIGFTSPGSKTVSLEVTSSCGTVTATEIFTVHEPPALDAGEDMEICNGEEIILTPVVNPEGNYTFSWTSLPSGAVLNQENPTVRPNQNTTYTLTVTNQNTGCTASDEFTVTVIPSPIIEFSIPDQILCSGETSLPVSTTPLPPGATIAWTSQSNGVTGVLASGTSEIPAQTLVNNSSQPIQVTYTAEITSTELGDCSVVPASYSITVNPSPEYEDERIEICSQSPMDFIPRGHVTGTLYTWTVEPVNTISGSSDQATPQNSLNQILSNTGDAPAVINYTVTPILNSCPGIPFDLAVTVQPSPGIEFSIPDQIICSGNLTSEVNITSDVPGAIFSWVSRSNGIEGVDPNGANIIPVQNLVNPTSAPLVVEFEITASTPGETTCEGVPIIYSITVTPPIKIEPSVSDFSGYQISCFGAGDGAIQLNPSGGDGNYKVSWSGPDGFSSTAENIENLAPGLYEVSVIDGSGCQFSETFEVNEPEPLTVELLDKTDVLCAGESTGSLSIEAKGGVENQAYAYSWTKDGQPYRSSTPTLSNIPAGIYQVTVSDQNNCTITMDTVEITEPDAPLTIAVEKGDISCYNANDGFIDIEVNGGQPPYSILWDFGSSQTSFDNMGPGIYTVTVRDNVGCSTVMPVEIIDAPIFKITPVVENISCHGAQDGSIQLNMEGKGPQSTIRWDHGEEVENLFNLSAGSYGVTITDPEGCLIRQEFNIIEPAPLVLENQITDALDCLDPQSGGIRLHVSGGTPPFTFRWSNGAEGPILSDLSSGQYGVEVADASGCVVSGLFVVKRPEQLSVTAFRTTEASCGPKAVQEEIRISVNGGVAPYTINWSGGSISDNGRVMTTDQPGMYLLNVTDGNGCQYQESFEVINSEVIVDAEIQSTAFDLHQSHLVNFEIQFVNKSVGPIIAYYWDFGDGNTSFEENPKHTYQLEGEHEITLTVTDIYGCETQTKMKINVFDYFLVIPNVFTPNGDGVNDYFFPKFLNIEKLEFWVLNKWGESIYYTDELAAEGWNGQINGEPAIPGNYVYKLSFQTIDGRKQTRTDVFLLLK